MANSPSPALNEHEEFQFRDRLEREQKAARRQQPDGTSLATPENIMTALRNAHNAGDVDAARRLARMYVRGSQKGPSQPSWGAILAANREAEAHEQHPVEDAIDMWGSVPKGAADALGGITNALSHPIDAVKSLAGRVGHAVMHPIDTAKSAFQGVKDMTPEKAGNFLGSSLAGGLAGKAAGVLGDVVGPSIKAVNPLSKPVSPIVRDLASRGVVTTPGMRGGKLGSAFEQRLSSVPFAGDAIKRARGKATEQWNRAEINDAIKDAGGTELPKNRTGRDAIFHAESEMQKGYSRVLSQMRGDLASKGPTGTLRQSLEQTKRLAKKDLDAKASKTVSQIIDDEVLKKFDSGGRISGEKIKEIHETLRTEADSHRRGNYQERKVARALDQARAHLDAMLKRENPKLASELEGVDRGYAKFKAISRASRYSKKNAGTYTPAQKLRAIESRDRSKDKQRFASGKAHGQKEAERAESVLGNTEPDSGTAGRLLAFEAGIGGLGYATAHPLAALGVVSLPAIYSQAVLRALQNRALKRGGPYTPITSAAPAGAILGAREDPQP